MQESDYPPFLASEYAPRSLQQAAFYILPVPLEQSVSYGAGTALGPGAILRASQQLEAWEAGRYAGRRGFCTDEPIDCARDIETILAEIEAKVSFAVQNHALPVLLGGEHTLSLGALRAFAHLFQEDVGIVQIDAHADLRESYEGNPYSHASVMYRAVADLHYRLVQFGVREFCPAESETRRRFGVLAHDADELADLGLPEVIVPLDFPRKVYVTFDVDGLDASLMPATGTPSPGGLFWHDARRLLTRLAQQRQIVGFDVVELAPKPGLHSADFTAAKLVHLLMALCLDSFDETIVNTEESVF
ncbi:MAG: agmatinase [Desulfovibrio sp.]|nr:agmatinase [Desulfovibrio sp.]